MEIDVLLNALRYVGTSPLTYVAFLAVVLVWGIRSYFEHVRKSLKNMDMLPEPDRLPFSQMLILGFPKELSEQRLLVIKWRYQLAAYAITLMAIVIMIAFIAHAYGLKQDENQRRIIAIENEQQDARTALKRISDLNVKMTIFLEKSGTVNQIEMDQLKKEAAEMSKRVTEYYDKYAKHIDNQTRETLEQARKSSEKILAKARMRQFALALHNYHNDFARPSKSGPSWRLGILPYLEADNIISNPSNRYNLSEPWDSPGNKAFLEMAPNLFLLPGESGKYTNFVQILHPKLGSAKNLTVIDSLPNPVMVIEAKNTGIFWTETRDYTIDEAIQAIRNSAAEKDGSFGVRGDGSVIFIPKSLSDDEARKLLKGENRKSNP